MHVSALLGEDHCPPRLGRSAQRTSRRSKRECTPVKEVWQAADCVEDWREEEAGEEAADDQRREIRRKGAWDL